MPWPNRRRAKTRENVMRPTDSTRRKSRATTCRNSSMPVTSRKSATTGNRSSLLSIPSRGKGFRKLRERRKPMAKPAPSMLMPREKIPAFPSDAKLATRKAGGEVLQPIAQAMPNLVSGSADLYGSTMNYIKDSGDFTRDNPGGRNIRFGIREHGMCAILNGVSYHGIFRASGATFLVFSDYARPSIRLAALARLPNIYIFTHDSIGVGEDGPTHQPVETLSALRLIRHLDVIRPADPEETAGAFVAACERIDGPTLLSLTRQNVPMLNDIDVKLRREGVRRGGYIEIGRAS